MKAFIAAVAVIIFAVSTETEGAYGPALNPKNSKLAPLPPGQVYCFKEGLCSGNVIVTASIFECCRIQRAISYFDPDVHICQWCL